jgi:hypothetical protein
MPQSTTRAPDKHMPTMLESFSPEQNTKDKPVQTNSQKKCPHPVKIDEEMFHSISTR